MNLCGPFLRSSTQDAKEFAHLEDIEEKLSHDNYLCVYLLIYWVYWFCFIVWLGSFFFT